MISNYSLFPCPIRLIPFNWPALDGCATPEGEEEEAASGAEEEPVEKKPSKADAGGKKRLNATDTDWENQNFQINSGFKLKVASWNVSGLRAWLEKGGRNYIMHERPDIVCLQETKCKPDVIPPEATISGQ